MLALGGDASDGRFGELFKWYDLTLCGRMSFLAASFSTAAWACRLGLGRMQRIGGGWDGGIGAVASELFAELLVFGSNLRQLLA
jgi:hypothetical protein